MGIKDKPMNFATTDIDQFRSHDPEVAANKEPIKDASGQDARITKTVRMRYKFGLFLKEEAHKRTMQTGEKVSEADLLDEALSDWYLKANRNRG